MCLLIQNLPRLAHTLGQIDKNMPRLDQNLFRLAPKFTRLDQNLPRIAGRYDPSFPPFDPSCLQDNERFAPYDTSFPPVSPCFLPDTLDFVPNDPGRDRYRPKTKRRMHLPIQQRVAHRPCASALAVASGHMNGSRRNSSYGR